MAKIPLETVIDHSGAFFAALEELTAKTVYVGIPEESASRTAESGQSNSATNALIGYVMEFGSPEKNIPARPFLSSAIRENQAAIVQRLRAISVAATEGEQAKVQNLRVALGLFAQRAVQTKISNGPFQPLAEATLKARARRGRSGARIELARRAAGLAPSGDFARPLIDTGQLRRAITYVIGPNKDRKKTIIAMTGQWGPDKGPKK